MKRWILFLVFMVATDSVMAAIEDTIRAAHLSSAYAAIINFSTEPDISASHLWVDRGSPDELYMRVSKLPLRHEFKLKTHKWKPVVQATVSRLKMEQTLHFDSSNWVDSEWTTYGATLGGGVRIPLSKDWSLLPAIDGGYAHLKNDADYFGSLSDALKPILNGKLFEWNADAWLLNGHLALFYNHTFGKLVIDAHMGGTVGHIASYDTTHAVQEFSETISTLSIKMDCAYPLGIAIADDPLFIVGRLGNSTILTDLENDIGISSVYETGLMLQADIARHGLPIKKIGIGAMILWGEDLIGWSLRTSYKF
jgi:hypothetical protein